MITQQLQRLIQDDLRSFDPCLTNAADEEQWTVVLMRNSTILEWKYAQDDVTADEIAHGMLHPWHTGAHQLSVHDKVAYTNTLPIRPVEQPYRCLAIRNYVHDPEHKADRPYVLLIPPKATD